MQIVGLQLSISSYALGGHLAGAVDRWIWRSRERQKGATEANADDEALAEEDAAKSKEAPQKYRLSRKVAAGIE